MPTSALCTSQAGMTCYCAPLLSCLMAGACACRYAEFKVVGNASVHLSGYYMPEHDHGVPLSWRSTFVILNTSFLGSNFVMLKELHH